MSNFPIMMKSFTIAVILSTLLLPGIRISAQESELHNFAKVPENSSEAEVVNIAANLYPSARQLTWQKMELTTFLHFTLNTYYDQEWGHGTEDAARFNPVEFDARQWVSVCKDAGSKCVIITCKHHDGFCLWPSKFTDHTVAASPFMNGKGDIVRDVANACKEMGLGFGVYLSPWDRHEKTYGSEAYNEHFRNQLTELLTEYGPIAEVWFDGACGEGPNGKKQIYDWASYYKLIRKLQPNAVIAIMGPDVRWVGTESGYGRETEWSVVPLDLADQDAIAAGSQQLETKEGFIPAGDMTAQDLGSRQVISKAKNLIWYPSEVDVSIRPGWFWHESENDRVKTPEKLLDIYFSSVGRNSLLLLNIPPDKRGLIHENDVASLKVWRKAIDQIFADNKASKAVLVHDANKPGASFQSLFDKNIDTYLQLRDNDSRTLEFELGSDKTFDVLLLQEPIQNGQRIEKFRLEAFSNEKWTAVAKGTTVGYKRLLRFDPVTACRVRLVIEESRLEPNLAEFGLYLQLPVASAKPGSASFKESMQVSLVSNDPGATIYYSADGSKVSQTSSKYSMPISIDKSTELRFMAVSADGREGFEFSSSYCKAVHNLTLTNAADPQYTGGGPSGLSDGMNGSNDFADGRWSGFNGVPLDATLDLGKVSPVKKVSISFMEATASWIFKPATVRISVSEDGINYRIIKNLSTEVPTKDESGHFNVSATLDEKARYIKVEATPVAVIPAWHAGAGYKAWIFADEITVE